MMTALSVLAVGAFAWAAVTDIARRRISNRLVCALTLIGLIRVGAELAGGGGVGRGVCDLAVALAVFGIGAALHHFRALGGGDVKLLAAGALWLGAGAVGAFLAGTAVAGGLLALGFIGWRALRPPGAASLPYGVAIAAGGILNTLPYF